MSSPQILPVSCAIIEHQGLILLAQRSRGMTHPGKWEFPGGKWELGETPQQCLIREIKEELNLDIIIQKDYDAVIHCYSDKVIKLYSYLCSIQHAEIHLLEHQNIAWIRPDEFEQYDCSEADIKVWHQYQNKKALFPEP